MGALGRALTKALSGYQQGKDQADDARTRQLVAEHARQRQDELDKRNAERDSVDMEYKREQIRSSQNPAPKAETFNATKEKRDRISVLVGQGMSPRDAGAQVRLEFGEAEAEPKAYAPKTRDEYMRNQRELAGIQAANRAPPAPKEPTESERKNAALYNDAMDAKDALDNGKPSWWGEQAGKIPLVGNSIQGAFFPEQQGLEQASRQFVTDYNFMRSGASTPQEQLDQAYSTYGKSAGDSPDVKARKRSARNAAKGSMEIAGGRAINGIRKGPPSAPPKKPIPGTKPKRTAEQILKDNGIN